MNSTEGLTLFLGFLLFAGSVSFVYKWYMGSVNDAQGLFGIAGIAVSLVFPAFIVPELYRELFSGLRHLIVVPVGTAAAAAPLAVGEGAQQVLDATGRKVEGLWEKFVGMFTGGGKRAQLDVDAASSVAHQLQSFFQTLGSVDIFVANAGINAFTHVGKDELTAEMRIIQTNVIGAIASIDAAAAHFAQQKSGHIVGVSSLASMIAVPKQAAYCASKAAISMYLRSARIELARHNICVTDIQPGFVVTDIMPDIGKYPFAIPATKAAFEMAEAIEKGREEAIVPAFPWRLFKPFFRHIPNFFWKRL